MELSTDRFVLVPGFWLGAWAWDEVAAHLAAAGAQPHPLTLPGLEAPDAARARVRLQDHVDAVIAALRRPGAPHAVLVAHSGACAPVSMAVDQAPELVRRVVYVESGPLPDGAAVEPGLDPAATALPLPTWAEFEARGTSLDGLGTEARERFRRLAVPHPAGPAREPVRLRGEARRDVPVTLVASSFSLDQVHAMTAAGHPWFAELDRLRVDETALPTGHWPMWSRPRELAEVLLTAAG
jgi:pimeloyl-ACP methyl ester carboxylesterase